MKRLGRVPPLLSAFREEWSFPLAPFICAKSPPSLTTVHSSLTTSKHPPRYILSLHAHRHFHAPRRQRRRPQQNQNGRAPCALRISEIHRLPDFHPKRQRHFQNERAQSRETFQPDSKRHRTQLRLSFRCDSSHV